MKTLLAALNSRFSHQSLAIWALKASAPQQDIVAKDYNINQSLHFIFQDILGSNCDAVGFSCYIWNIEMIIKLSRDLKAAKPDLIIFWGGPEVSYTSELLLQTHQGVDFIIAGEGETAVRKLLETLETLETLEPPEIPDWNQIPNLFYRSNWLPHSFGSTVAADSLSDTAILHSSVHQAENLNQLPSPYTPEMLEAGKNKIVYFESSRGCDFRCQYCLSSLDNEPVRYLDLAMVLERLRYLFLHQIPLIKFVDRTFNRNLHHAKEILQFLAQQAENNLPVSSCHFEMAPDLFDQSLLDLIATLPPSSIQIECGIQSTNFTTLKAVKRPANWEKIKTNLEFICKKTQIHTHLDLIVGLPFEDNSSFIQSFNQVYAFKAQQLQIGFLKNLPGTQMPQYQGDDFRSYPPYEVIKTPWLSPQEILEWKKLDLYVDKLYNSRQLTETLSWLETFFPTPYALWSFLMDQLNIIHTPLSPKNLFKQIRQILHHHFPLHGDLINSLLKYDLLQANLLDGITADLLSPILSRAEIEKTLDQHFPSSGIRSGIRYRDFIQQYSFVSLEADPFLFSLKPLLAIRHKTTHQVEILNRLP